MNKKTWLIIGIVCCCIYILSPLDLLPEIALGPFGVIDDAGVLGFMLFLIKSLWGLRDSEERLQGEPPTVQVVEVDDEPRTGDPPKLTDGQ